MVPTLQSIALHQLPREQIKTLPPDLQRSANLIRRSVAHQFFESQPASSVANKLCKDAPYFTDKYGISRLETLYSNRFLFSAEERKALAEERQQLQRAFLPSLDLILELTNKMDEYKTRQLFTFFDWAVSQGQEPFVSMATKLSSKLTDGKKAETIRSQFSSPDFLMLCIQNLNTFQDKLSDYPGVLPEELLLEPFSAIASSHCLRSAVKHHDLHFIQRCFDSLGIENMSDSDFCGLVFPILSSKNPELLDLLRTCTKWQSLDGDLIATATFIRIPLSNAVNMPLIFHNLRVVQKMERIPITPITGFFLGTGGIAWDSMYLLRSSLRQAASGATFEPVAMAICVLGAYIFCRANKVSFGKLLAAPFCLAAATGGELFRRVWNKL